MDKITKIVIFVFFFLAISGCIKIISNQKANPLPQTILTNDWKMFRYDLTHSGFTDTNLSLPLKLEYKFNPSSKIINRVSSPVISRYGIVYFGARDHNFYAFDIKNNKILWKFKTETWIDASSVLFEDKIFFPCLDGNIYCMESLSGKLLWKYTTRDKIQWAAPVIASDSLLLYIGTENKKFYAIDINGKLKWKFDAQGAIYGTPAVSLKNVYFGDEAGFLYALDKFTGALVWKYKGTASIFSSPAIVKNKIIFPCFDGHVYAISESEGNFLWKFKTAASKIWSSPGSDGEHIYIGANDTFFYCLNSETGMLKWKFKTNYIIDTSPAITKNAVIFASMDGYIYILNKEDGKLLFSYKTYEKAFSSPAVADNYIVIGSGYEGYLWIFKAE